MSRTMKASQHLRLTDSYLSRSSLGLASASGATATTPISISSEILPET